MCGITGFVGPGDQDIIREMTRVMSARGPDAEGFWSDPDRGIHFGHRRLSIIDLDGGEQPMVIESLGLVMVYNGEIYNSPDLRQELERLGHHFMTHHSDTEVVMRAYAQWNTGMFERLNGMWAFCIWDQNRNKLICSRDRFGQKPFYYTSKGPFFAFGSQLDSLVLHPAVNASLSELSLKKYIAYSYVPEPATLFNEIKKLPAGCYLEIQLDRMEPKVSSFWSFHLQPQETYGTEDDLVEEFLELLEKAVKRRLLADVPLGVFLSGGLDSSLIAMLMAKVGTSTPQCFTISFEEKEFDEAEYARLVARHLKLPLQVTRITSEDAINNIVPILSRIDDPIGDSSLLPTYLLCRETAKHVKVALGGDGADELFAGYAPFHALKPARIYSGLIPRPLHRLFVGVVNLLPVSHGYMSLDFKLKKTLSALGYQPKLWLPIWMSGIKPNDLHDLFHEPISMEVLFEDAIQVWDECESVDPFDKALMFFTRMYLSHAILHKVDRAGMLNGLEVRSPFLDHELANFAMKLPNRFKLRGSTSKWLLKRAASSLLPSEITKRSKHGFALPVGSWIKNGTIQEPNWSLPAIQRNTLKRHWSTHRAGKADQRLMLWNLLSLNQSRYLAP